MTRANILISIDQRTKVRRLKSPLVVNVTEHDSIVAIAPYESQSLDAKAVKIQTDGGDYYVEWRSGEGFDADLLPAVLIHKVDTTRVDGNFLLDLDPGPDVEQVLDFGQSFTDGTVTITPSFGPTFEPRHCRVTNQWPPPKKCVHGRSCADPGDEMKFDVNCRARVKLTPIGERVFKHYYRRQRLNPAVYFKTDKEGYYEDKLWRIMQIFGAYMNMGQPGPFFDNEIELIRKSAD